MWPGLVHVEVETLLLNYFRRLANNSGYPIDTGMRQIVAGREGIRTEFDALA